jgi:MGT family glycosyltransferase
MNSNNVKNLLPGTKILFANFPADGHFNPLTGLAVHLKNLGCEVRWYTAASYAEKINKLGIRLYPITKAIDVSADNDIEEVFPERKKHKSQVSKLKFDMINVFILRSPEYYADIEDIYEEFDFDLMICDNCFGGIPFVKEKMNIPVLAIGVVPLPETSKDLAPPGLGITPSKGFFGKQKQAALRFIADKLLFSKPSKVMQTLLRSYDIDPGDANIFDVMIQKSTLLLQSGTPGFEYQRSDLSDNIRFIGPLLPYSKKKEGKPWYNEKLNRYEKMILVTQGTVEKDCSKLIIPTLEAFKDSRYLVVVTTGGSQTKELQEKYRQDNIIIEDFIPFDEAMKHADVYISNGGYGGVLLAIQNGLPMVVAGVHEGKNEINARVGYFELGINLKTEKPNVLRLKESVEKVLGTEKYAENVRDLREEFAQYPSGELCASYVASVLAGSKTRIIKEIKKAEPIY